MVFYLIKFVFSLEHIIGVRSKHCLKVWTFDVFHSIYRVIYRAKYSKFYLDRTPIIWWLSEKKIVHFGNQYGSRSHKIHNLNKFILDLDVLSTIFLMISFLFYFFFLFICQFMVFTSAPPSFAYCYYKFTVELVRFLT